MGNIGKFSKQFFYIYLTNFPIKCAKEREETPGEDCHTYFQKDKIGKMEMGNRNLSCEK